MDRLKSQGRNLFVLNWKNLEKWSKGEKKYIYKFLIWVNLYCFHII